MGNCCGNEEEQAPLLTGYNNVGVRTGTLSEPAPVVTDPPASARQHRVTDRRDFETSIELITSMQLQTVPVTSLDKTFQDLCKLYNDVVDSFRSLEEETHKFKEHFVEETNGVPVLSACVKILVQRCGDAKLKLERKTKTFLELTYDRTEVAHKCHGNPENCLEPLEHFKNACRHIREVLERSPRLQTNVAIVLNDEDTLRKDISKADLSAEVTQAGTKAFVDNVSKLRVMAAGTDTLKRDVEKKFKEYSKASEGFFTEE